MTPLVSVVIPAYNAVETIIPCVKSVLNQTYKCLEIIVVDDGSTDATRIILEEYIKELCIDNLQIISQDNAGPSAARNLAIELSKGEYIAFLDSDDLWMPSKIELQLSVFLENPQAMIVGTISQKEQSTDEISEIFLNKLVYQNYFTTSTVMCRRRIFEFLKFNRAQKYSEDYRLWMEIVARYGSGFLLNKNLVVWANKERFGSYGLSANLWEMEKGELSNYRYLWKESIISSGLLVQISCCSLFKFLCRVVLTCARVLTKWQKK